MWTMDRVFIYTASRLLPSWCCCWEWARVGRIQSEGFTQGDGSEAAFPHTELLPPLCHPESSKYSFKHFRMHFSV